MKTKSLLFRVSDDMYNLINSLAEDLHITKTVLFYQAILFKEYLKVEQSSDYRSYQKELSLLSNNMNQCARALNTIARRTNEEFSIDLVASNPEFEKLTQAFLECWELKKKIWLSTEEEEKAFYKFRYSRELNPQLEDFKKTHSIELKDIMSEYNFTGR